MLMTGTPEELIAHSSVAAVVSDPRQQDNPIIACNDAFMALTGFSRNEIIGYNCRFLRGPQTEPEQTAILRDAVHARRPVMVELTNYRKDGQPFRNAVMIAPLFDDSGEVRYFLGSQIAIDEESEERHARARTSVEKLSVRQHQVLQGLAKGRLNKQVAYDLGLTERTVKMHRAAILRVLGVQTTAEAIRIAIEAGF